MLSVGFICSRICDGLLERFSTYASKIKLEALLIHDHIMVPKSIRIHSSIQRMMLNSTKNDIQPIIDDHFNQCKHRFKHK